MNFQIEQKTDASITGIAGIIGLVLVLLFSSKHVKVIDDKYCVAAGKELDDALTGVK